MNIPFSPGIFNNNQTFDLKGLWEQLASVGKKGLGDKIYNGHPDECSTFNAIDSEAVRKFQARVQMRHEQFNKVVKELCCASTPFCHKPDKVEKFKICFEAVTVVFQCRVEHCKPLFDSMVGFWFHDTGTISALFQITLFIVLTSLFASSFFPKHFGMTFQHCLQTFLCLPIC